VCMYLRGGSWNNYDFYREVTVQRSSSANSQDNGFGFRIFWRLV
jgi:hypothetical protein